MRTAQLTAWQPPAVVCSTRSGHTHSLTLKPSNLAYPPKNISLSLKNTSHPSSSIVCLSNSGSNSASGSEGSPWEGFRKALGNITGGGRSIEDVLKQQMQRKEFYPEGGGSGGGPPRGGGNGDGGGGSDGFNGAEGEDFWDEVLQAFLATVGIVSLYIYLIKGDDLIRLAKDYRIYKITGEESDRLKKVRQTWKEIRKSFEIPHIEDDPFWLEKLIILTKTSFDNPRKYMKYLIVDDDDGDNDKDDNDDDDDDDDDGNGDGDDDYDEEDDD